MSAQPVPESADSGGATVTIAGLRVSAKTLMSILLVLLGTTGGGGVATWLTSHGLSIGPAGASQIAVEVKKQNDPLAAQIQAAADAVRKLVDAQAADHESLIQVRERTAARLDAIEATLRGIERKVSRGGE